MKAVRVVEKVRYYGIADSQDPATRREAWKT
jgi:hypothetical protein